MPADYSAYIDLTPHDVSPTEVYTGAIQLGRLVLPEFEIRQGTPDDAMLQAFAYMSSLSVAAINRLPDRLMQGICSLMGVTRSPGTRATVSARITLNDYEEFNLPRGTVFLHTATDGEGTKTISYETTEAYSVPASEAEDELGNENPLPTLDIVLTSTYTGINDVVRFGVALQPQSVLPQVDSVYSFSDFVNGSFPEEDDVYLDRAATYLQSLSSNLATSTQISTYILSSFDNVDRCKVYDLTDFAADLDIDGPAKPGHVAIFLYGVESTLSTEDLYNVLVGVSNKATAGIQFTTNNFSLINVGVNMSLKFDTSYGESEIVDSVTAAIVDYLSPQGFTSRSEGVRINELQAVVSNVAGVLYVESTTLSDVDGVGSLGDPLVSGGGSSDILFLKKGLLPVSYEANITISATPL